MSQLCIRIGYPIPNELRMPGASHIEPFINLNNKEHLGRIAIINELIIPDETRGWEIDAVIGFPLQKQYSFRPAEDHPGYQGPIGHYADNDSNPLQRLFTKEVMHSGKATVIPSSVLLEFYHMLDVYAPNNFRSVLEMVSNQLLQFCIQAVVQLMQNSVCLALDSGDLSDIQPIYIHVVKF